MERPLYFTEKLIWTRYFTLLLGVWLLVTPFTFNYTSTVMVWNDLISGLLLVLFSLLSFRQARTYAPWLVCIVGIWLQLAPLAFWAPDSFVYLNDTMTGVLAITFSILVPGTPGQRISQGAECPPGWSYNPSSWNQRLPIIFFGFVGWFLARYMAAYQLGYSDHVVDPVFGDGTLRVITSTLSQQFPISDAGLGAFAYTLEALLGAKGDSRRWHTMPWMVILFGILVVPLGFVSVLLIILQPILVGAWCFWCLLAGICMLTMIALTIDEAVAVLQYLARIRREGQPFWQIFWKGGEVAGSEEQLPPIQEPIRRTFPSMVRGLTPSWNLLASALLGLWLTFATRMVFQAVGRAADSDYIFGALVVTIAVISLAEVARALRFVNILFGLFIAVHPWILTGETFASGINSLVCGILIALLSFRKGRINNQYGRWDRCIR
jgi:hypothetical protein